jgi:hypothetical protein
VCAPGRVHDGGDRRMCVRSSPYRRRTCDEHEGRVGNARRRGEKAVEVRRGAAVLRLRPQRCSATAEERRPWRRSCAYERAVDVGRRRMSPLCLS